jgi:hypothetical protein
LTLLASVDKLLNDQFSAFSRGKNWVISVKQISKITIKVEQEFIDGEIINASIASGDAIRSLNNAVCLAGWVRDIGARHDQTCLRIDIGAVQCHVELALPSGSRSWGRSWWKSRSRSGGRGDDNDNLSSVIAWLGQSSDRIGSIARHISDVFMLLASVDELLNNQFSAFTGGKNWIFSSDQVSEITIKVEQQFVDRKIINASIASSDTVHNLNNTVGSVGWVGDFSAW